MKNCCAYYIPMSIRKRRMKNRILGSSLKFWESNKGNNGMCHTRITIAFEYSFLKLANDELEQKHQAKCSITLLKSARQFCM